MQCPFNHPAFPALLLLSSVQLACFHKKNAASDAAISDSGADPIRPSPTIDAVYEASWPDLGSESTAAKDLGGDVAVGPDLAVDQVGKPVVDGGAAKASPDAAADEPSKPDSPNGSPSGCVPTGPEVCDGVDNDCNGVIDDLQESCGSDVGECRRGVYVCLEGKKICAGDSGPTIELCDGKDNDCDGARDEDFPELGKECSIGLGECKNVGVFRCAANGLTVECSVAPKPPGVETCNGKDDDCDGVVDYVVSSGIARTVCPVGPSPPCSPSGPEVCDGKDNDCNGLADDIQGSCGESRGMCLQGHKACDGTREICVGGRPPEVEICDGKDNDCDGLTDEDFPDLGSDCSEGLGECLRRGQRICSPDGLKTICSARPGEPGDERTSPCNHKDDDCDGLVDYYVDQGHPISTCSGSTLDACVPSPEVCDGVDNDCNGVVDDLRTPCGIAMGACQPGHLVCLGTTSVCAGAVGPQPELCDGVDNDCDGLTDEDFPGLGGECSAGLGACKATGTWVCSPDHRTVQCSAVPLQPGAEQCNGLDDDCDGIADFTVIDGIAYPACFGASCIPTGASEICDGIDNDCDGYVDNVNETCGSDVGECRPGVVVCANAQPVCAGGVSPGVEICDGKDNDCNGTPDDPFPNLGHPCNVGRGECARSGVVVCSADGLAEVCSVAPGVPGDEKTDPCNGKDDDCDGLVDYYVSEGKPYSVCICRSSDYSAPTPSEDPSSTSLCNVAHPLACETNSDEGMVIDFCVAARATQGLWAQCVFHDTSSWQTFDADWSGEGLVEVRFDVSAPLRGAIDLYVGAYPKRKFVVLADGNIAAGSYHKLVRPQDMRCPTYLTGNNPPDCLPPSYDSPLGCIPPACRNGCTDGSWSAGGILPECRFGYSAVPLWLTFESVPDNTPSQSARVAVKSIVHHDRPCLCSKDSDCRDSAKPVCDRSLTMDGEGICRS
jgi:hypothetical protein